jgi:deoxyribonuclease-4
MLRIGAHMSVAGGVSRAVDRAERHGCEALQIFSKNANRWISPPLDPAEIRRFRQRVDETGVTPVVSHASYLINLATAFEEAVRQPRRSRRAHRRRLPRPAHLPAVISG